MVVRLLSSIDQVRTHLGTYQEPELLCASGNTHFSTSMSLLSRVEVSGVWRSVPGLVTRKVWPSETRLKASWYSRVSRLSTYILYVRDTPCFSAMIISGLAEYSKEAGNVIPSVHAEVSFTQRGIQSLKTRLLSLPACRQALPRESIARRAGRYSKRKR